MRGDDEKRIVNTPFKGTVVEMIVQSYFLMACRSPRRVFHVSVDNCVMQIKGSDSVTAMTMLTSGSETLVRHDVRKVTCVAMHLFLF